MALRRPSWPLRNTGYRFNFVNCNTGRSYLSLDQWKPLMTSGLIKRRMIRLHSRCLLGLPPRKLGNCFVLCFQKIVSTKECHLTLSLYLCTRLESFLQDIWTIPQSYWSQSFYRTCWVSFEQPAHITQDRLSSRATTPSIDLAYKSQQSQFASAEGEVPSKEYPSRKILWATMLSGWLFSLPPDSKVWSCSLSNQRLASKRVPRITK